MKTILTVLIFLGFSSVANAQAITFTPNPVTMNVGETKTVSVSGPLVFYIASNSNPGTVSAVQEGSIIRVKGFAQGNSAISICKYESNAVSCASFDAIVAKAPENQQNTQANQTISFSRKEVTVNVGQSETVTVSGSGSGTYYIASYGSDSVNATINGNTITLVGGRAGGSNISICQFGGTCGNVYGFVPATEANIQTASTAQTTVPVLTAFYVASNNVGGGFTGRGAALTIKFNTSEDIVSNVVRVGGTAVAMNGTGSGPYAGTYYVTGAEASPIPVYIEFMTARAKGSATFAIGSGAAPVATTPLQPTLVAGVGAAVPSVTFSRLLQSGSSGPDVVALQNFLRKLGIYDGPVTGTFGLLTSAAVKKYQAARKLSQAGVVGPATLKALNNEN